MGKGRITEQCGMHQCGYTLKCGTGVTSVASEATPTGPFCRMPSPEASQLPSSVPPSPRPPPRPLPLPDKRLALSSLAGSLMRAGARTSGIAVYRGCRGGGAGQCTNGLFTMAVGPRHRSLL